MFSQQAVYRHCGDATDRHGTGEPSAHCAAINFDGRGEASLPAPAAVELLASLPEFVACHPVLVHDALIAVKCFRATTNSPVRLHSRTEQSEDSL